MSEFQTDHLDLCTTSGVVWLKCLPNAYLFDAMRCGHIAAPFWPSELGEQPDWFDAEISQCDDWWFRDWEMSRAADLAALWN